MPISDGELDKRDNKRAKKKENRERRARGTGSADLRVVDWRPLVALAVALSDAGGALRVGLTRDAGAYALGVYLGEDYATEYVRPAEDWETAIGEIAAAWLPDGGALYLDFLISLRQ